MKTKCLLIVLLCFFMCSCSNGMNTDDGVTPNSASATNSSSTVNTETALAEETVFEGLQKGDDKAYGNTASCLNMGGILYAGDIRIKGGSSLLIDGVELNYAAQGINYLNGTVYFIDNSNNHTVCSISVSGDDYTEIIEARASFLMVSEDSMIFSDENNNLYIKATESAKLISDKNAAWVNPYGEWLIFTELNNGCGVFAFNTKTYEKIRILEYGFFPAVHNDYLYFQDNSGYICKLSLKTGKQECVVEKWGQKFCFLDEVMYFVGADVIHRYDMNSGELVELYKPETAETIIDSLFLCGGELYLTERNKDTTSIKSIDIDTGSVLAVL